MLSLCHENVTGDIFWPKEASFVYLQLHYENGYNLERDFPAVTKSRGCRLWSLFIEHGHQVEF